MIKNIWYLIAFVFLANQSYSQVSILENDFLKFENPENFLQSSILNIGSLQFQDGFAFGSLTPTTLQVGDDLVNSRLTSQGLLTKEYAVLPGSESLYGMHNLCFKTDFSVDNYYKWILGTDPINDDAGFGLYSEDFDIDLLLIRFAWYVDKTNGYFGVGGGYFGDEPEEPLDVFGNARIRNSLFIQDNGELHTTGEIFYGAGPKYGMGGTTNLNPFIPAGNDGHIFESKHSNSNNRSSGIYLDGDEVSIWSPGNNDALLLVWDEDTNSIKWFVDGDGNAHETSDASFKENMESIDNALAKLSRIEGKRYNYIARQNKESPENPEMTARPKKKKLGVIAQNVEDVFPELVSTDRHGHKFVNHNGFIPVLIEAIKEQQKTIEELSKKVDQLSKLVKTFGENQVPERKE